MNSDPAPRGTTLTFTYRLRGGDAVATIGDGRQSAEMGVWLVTDALGDLLRSVVELLQGYDFVWCEWQDDPGAHKWVFRRDADTVAIRILRFPASFPGYGASEERAEVIFEATCPLLKFATKVRNEARRLLNEVGSDEYQRQTRRAFPQARLVTLSRLIQERRSLPHTGGRG